MRIAIVAPPWLPVPPPAYGGTEAVVDALARGLDASGHDVLLIGHPDSACPVARASVVPAGEAVPMGRAAAELEHAIGAYALARDFDVVSDHTIGGPVHGAAYPDLPVVATNHNPFSRTRNAIYSTLVGRGSIVAISESHARSTTLPIAAVIHHGIDVDTFPVGTGDRGYLAMLTRMTPDKGIERAIRLARAAGVPLKIAAKIREQREHDYFESVIAPLLDSTVEFLGEVDAAGKRELLAGAVGLLNPIEWDEPFGMAMIESLACGTPVVATPKGAAPEIVGSGTTGFLADDDAGLVDAIGRLDEIDRGACREHIRRSFSIEGMCERYVIVFEREIASRESRIASV